MIDCQQMTIDGLAFDLRRGGTGRDLLFLHPGTGCVDHDDFFEVLAARFRVTAPSSPGFDGSENSKSFTRIGDLAYFYLDLIEVLGLDRPVIVGSSFGAWLAAEIAVRCKSVCSSIVLIGPVGAKFGGEREREIFDLFAYPLYEQDKYLFSDAALSGRSYMAADQAQLLRMARNFETFARIGWSPTLHNPKLRQRLSRLTMPALVLRGEADQIVSEQYCRQFAKAIPGGRFESIADAGHYPQIEQPEAVCARIEAIAAAELV